MCADEAELRSFTVVELSQTDSIRMIKWELISDRDKGEWT